MKKRILLLSAAAVLVTLTIVGGTLAATSAAGNVATNQMAAQTLAVNISDSYTIDAGKLMPGDELDSKATSFVVQNTAQTPAYVRVTVKKYWTDSETNAKNTELDSDLLNLSVSGSWITAQGGMAFSSGETDVFYYSAPVAAGEGISLPLKILIGKEADDKYVNKGIQLDVTVEAVQFVSGDNELNANGILSTFGVAASLNADGSINSIEQ